MLKPKQNSPHSIG